MWRAVWSGFEWSTAVKLFPAKQEESGTSKATDIGSSIAPGFAAPAKLSELRMDGATCGSLVAVAARSPHTCSPS